MKQVARPSPWLNIFRKRKGRKTQKKKKGIQRIKKRKNHPAYKITQDPKLRAIPSSSKGYFVKILF